MDVVVPSIAEHLNDEGHVQISMRLAQLATDFLSFETMTGKPTFPVSLLQILAKCGPLVYGTNAPEPYIIALSAVFMAAPSETMLIWLSKSELGKACLNSGCLANADVQLKTSCLMELAGLKNVPYIVDILVDASRHSNGESAALAAAAWTAAPHVSGQAFLWWTRLVYVSNVIRFKTRLFTQLTYRFI